MTKERLKEILEKSNYKLYVVGVDFGKGQDRGIWRKFALYVLYNNELLRLHFNDNEEAPPFYVKKHKTKSGQWKGGYFESGAIGMDRVVDIVYHLSYWLYGDYYKLSYDFLSY